MSLRTEIQDPEKPSAARGPVGAVSCFGQYVDDPANNKAKLQLIINDYLNLRLCAKTRLRGGGFRGWDSVYSNELNIDV